jgi:RNA polymerase sigma-70 factor (ECF subfamily)
MFSGSENDEEIIALYKNSEEEAFKSLISRYISSLYNFTVRLTDQNNAPDIVQETFIKVWKNLHKFDSSKASFKTWIFTIAKNTTTDFLRGKKSLLFSDIDHKTDEKNDSFSENIPDENLLPDEVLQKLQDSDLLNKLLNKLSIEHKTILILHYQEDLTFDEIGKILNKPLNTVKSQHRRAIIVLRKMLN